MKYELNSNGALSVMMMLGLSLLAQSALSQNALKFTSVNATPENAIQLHWASNTNEVYEIDYANALATNSNGNTAWLKLYDDYPAHPGSNTFWLDTGNYHQSPYVLHPKYASMRFYRIVLTGTNTGGDNPAVAIAVPTNGAVVSGDVTVTVNATSDQPVLRTLLYVDGEEMPSSDDGSNYVINSCEWPNGVHTFFAVAKSQSGYEGFPDDRSVTYNRTVSSYANIDFENLISRVAFSQPYFEPALGQTQVVTAAFAANCNWTLQIQDEDGNTVRNASGSGSSMIFDWDGTGDQETNIPDGVYTYLISAQTNGMAGEEMISGSFAHTFSTPSDDSSQLWASSTDGGAVPLALYPPGFDTNGLTIFSASPSEMRVSSTSFASTTTFEMGSASPALSAISSQSTTAPSRPSTKKVKGSKGTYGVAYLQYLPSGFTGHGPPTGLPFPLTQFIALDGRSATANVDDAQVIVFKDTADAFEDAMQNAGWKRGFLHANADFRTNDLVKSSLGGNGIFNTNSIGLTMTHGSYATATTASDPVLNTYWWFGANTFVKLSDCSFGGSGTNGLKWMAMFGCNLLRNDNYQSMYTHLKLPINNNLHLLLGCETFAGATADIGKLWAKKMTKSFLLGGPETIQNAWFHAGQDAYHYATNINNGPWFFRAAGWPNCFDDTLKAYSDPNSGNPANITFEDAQVYPYSQ